MSYLLALAQCQSSPDYRKNLEKARYFAKEAQNAHAQLLVFPEYFMVPFELSAKEYLHAAQPMDGPFVKTMQKIAEEFQLWIVFTMNEKSNTFAQKSYNTSIIVDNKGRILAKYQKTHLFDAFGTQESNRTIPGNHLFTPVDTPFGKLGLGMCYDLRFPELARAAALHDCDLLLYPSAWVKGPMKSTQWHTLLTARAIENSCFTAGCCYCSEKYLGESQITDPFGTVIASGGCTEELVIGQIELEKIKKARDINPWRDHRRDELYTSVIQTL